MCVIMDCPTQKLGYLDVKQSGKVKGRRLKSWKRRWVVLTKMTDMSSDQLVARVDLFENEAIWRSGQQGDRTTFMLDHVTSIRKASSRTRPHAFEVIQGQPELVFSGISEIDSFSWMLTLQQIFTPHLVDKAKDSYRVLIQPNADASRWNLGGEYRLAVSPACLSLNDLHTGSCYISWGLSTLMRFNVSKDKVTGDSNTLVIDCGRNGPTGESTFGFVSSEASEILTAIRQSICQALAQKQNARQIQPQPRYRSISESSSEKQFRSILDNSPIQTEPTDRDRSESDSSGCTSPGSQSTIIDNPLSSKQHDSSVGIPSRLSSSELGSLNESDEHDCDEHSASNSESFSSEREERSAIYHHQRHSSLPSKPAKGDDPGYAVIKDVDNAEGRSRRNTIPTEDPQSSSGTVTAPEQMLPPPRRKRAETLNTAPKNVSFDDSIADEQDFIPDSDRTPSHSSPLPTRHAHGLIGQQTSGDDSGNVLTDFDVGNLSPPSGGLSRRRSSSTPDLQSFWKHRASFENVYEELDAVRSAKSPTRAQTKSGEAPPALPARPFKLILPTPRLDHRQTVTRLKKSLPFQKSKTDNRKSLMSFEKIRGCICDYPYISCKGFLLSKHNVNICSRCGGSTDVIDGESVGGMNTKPHRDDSDSTKGSNGNHLYASIPDVKDKACKQRRASETQRPSIKNFSVIQNQDGFDKPKFYSLRRDGSPNRNVRPSADDSSLSDTVGHNNFPSGPCRLSGGHRNDPLISFFIDDDKFGSNPMVTGQFNHSSNANTNSNTNNPNSNDNCNNNSNNNRVDNNVKINNSNNNSMKNPFESRDFTTIPHRDSDTSIFSRQMDFNVQFSDLEDFRADEMKASDSGVQQAPGRPLSCSPPAPHSRMRSDPITYSCLRHPHHHVSHGVLIQAAGDVAHQLGTSPPVAHSPVIHGFSNAFLSSCPFEIPVNRSFSYSSPQNTPPSIWPMNFTEGNPYLVMQTVRTNCHPIHDNGVWNAAINGGQPTPEPAHPVAQPPQFNTERRDSVFAGSSGQGRAASEELLWPVHGSAPLTENPAGQEDGYLSPLLQFGQHANQLQK